MAGEKLNFDFSWSRLEHEFKIMTRQGLNQLHTTRLCFFFFFPPQNGYGGMQSKVIVFKGDCWRMIVVSNDFEKNSISSLVSE